MNLKIQYICRRKTIKKSKGLIKTNFRNMTTSSRESGGQDQGGAHEEGRSFF